MSEHDEQATFFEWVRLNRTAAPSLEVRKALSRCYAVPNGAAMKESQRRRMSREGMENGIPDVNLDCPTCPRWMFGSHQLDVDLESFWSGCLSGLRIEHKYRKSISAKIQNKIDRGDYLVDLSPKQKEKRELLIDAGYKVVVSYSAAQSIRAVFEYLPFEVNDYQGIKEFL